MRKNEGLSVSIVLLSMLLGASIACSKRSNDDTISKDIQTKAAADPDTKDSQVLVGAKDGKVTLTGKVRTSDAQQKLEQIAREETGATAVDDQTTVEADLTRESSPTTRAATVPAPAPIENPKPKPLVVPAGTVLTVRLGQALGSKTSQTGQTFIATLAQAVLLRGNTALPSGSDVSGRVVSAKAKGKFKGEGELHLALTSISNGGHTYQIQTSVQENTAKGKGKRTAATTGGGAAGGALIGGIAGGGKGAGIGALVGAGAGLVGGAMTGNKQIEIPAESVMSFKLSAPLRLEPSSE
jgi:hypothetical protein